MNGLAIIQVFPLVRSIVHSQRVVPSRLPPATSRTPFIVLRHVYENFCFMVLRQNRRVVSDDTRRDEIEGFHQVLSDVSRGISSECVKQFIVDAYVRGAAANTADLVAFEGGCW